MSVNRYYAPVGKRVYEFRNGSEALAAKEIFRRFIGTQDQFERAMTIRDIPFAERQDVDRTVYRVDLTDGLNSPFCVTAIDMYDATDWVKTNIRRRGFVIANMNHC